MLFSPHTNNVVSSGGQSYLKISNIRYEKNEVQKVINVRNFLFFFILMIEHFLCTMAVTFKNNTNLYLYFIKKFINFIMKLFFIMKNI